MCIDAILVRKDLCEWKSLEGGIEIIHINTKFDTEFMEQEEMLDVCRRECNARIFICDTTLNDSWCSA